MNKGYVITKNSKNKEIEIIEYEQQSGFDICPKNNIKKGNSINVNKVIFMSPTLIEKLLKKKIDREYKKILSLLTEVATDDSCDTGKLAIALNEVELFKSIVKRKYIKFMDEKKSEQLLKRLNMMSKELRKRIFEIEEEKLSNIRRGGKSR